MSKPESDKFRHALLKLLSNVEGEWCSLNDMMETARNMATELFGMPDYQYSTLKAVRQSMRFDGLIEVRKGGDSHWEMRATKKGVTLGDALPDDYETSKRKPETSIPATPFRVGVGHLMPGATWKSVMDDVRSGKLDLVIIPRGRKLKVRYWDDVG